MLTRGELSPQGAARFRLGLGERPVCPHVSVFPAHRDKTAMNGAQFPIPWRVATWPSAILMTGPPAIPPLGFLT